MAARPVLLGALVWVVCLAVGRTAIVPPEHCPTVTVGDIEAAQTAAVGWLTRNQMPDGQWLYRYDRAHDTLDDGPQLVRHAGVTMSLYQADAAGIPGTLAAADKGADWALAQLVDTDGDGGTAQAVQANGAVPTGATALLTAGLAVRKQATGSDRYDDELRAMGRFLADMVEPSGAVLANWDPTTQRPVPGGYSSFYTGEALWGLSMLATVDPDGGWVEPAERIAHYISTERDSAEHRFPPVSDHWGAYGLAQLAIGAHRPLTADERAYTERLAGLFGAQIRVESQRAAGGFVHATFRRGQASGAGLGTIGEGLGNLYRLAATPGVDLPGRNDLDVLGERVACTAGIIVERQVDAADAATTGHPGAAEGAWFRGGVTQKDDQQHSLSALLLAQPAVDRGFTPGRSMDDTGIARVIWLVLVAVAALNPVRPKQDPKRPTRRDAAIGAGITAAVLVGVALVTEPLLRAIDISPSTSLMAVGLLVGLGAAADHLGPTPVPPSTWGPAAVLYPTLLRPAPVAMVLGIAASVGVLAAVAAAAAIVVAAGFARPSAARALAWVVPAVAVVGGIDLFVHGIFTA